VEGPAVIAKHISMRSVRKNRFAELVGYITDQQGKAERVEHVKISNCCSTDVEWAISEVRAIQQQNTRAESDKTYHLLIGFAAGDVPSPEILQAIEERVCSALGYGEHQRVSAVHNDTDNLHIHIAINKIHPRRLTMHQPYRDYKILGEICTKLENEYDLQRVDRGARKQGAQNRADDMEHMAGVESLIGWIKRGCLDQIYGACSWSDLHQVMRANGLAIRERGNGFVIGDINGTNVKASSIARDLSKTTLEARLGPFQPENEALAGIVPVREYRVKPMSSRVDTTELYARYKGDQQLRHHLRAQEWANARDKKQRLIEAAKRTGRLKRATIKLMGGGGLGKKVLYGLTSKTLRAEVEQINKQYLKDRQDIYERYRRLAWNDWLQKQATDGDRDALAALRARKARQGLKDDTIGGKTVKNADGQPGTTPDATTKMGTIVYEVGAAVIRDDGERFKVSRGAPQAGLEAALRMAIHRYGDNICVTGSDEFKERIARAAAVGQLDVTFDDDALESRRQALLAGTTDKEANDGRQGYRQHQGPGARGRPEVSGRVIPGAKHDSGVEAGRGSRGRAERHSKSNVGAVGKRPPPEGQNRLRNLSQLGVVHIASGGEVLLPGHVLGDLEHQGAQSNNSVRRNVPRPGLTAEQMVAVEMYIGEREDKRAQGLAVAKHTRYERSAQESASYGGLRRVDGHCLALLKRADEVMVLPVDEATARRLMHMSIGTQVVVTPQGSVKSKGRGR
jgi:hypothetical protein